MLFELIHDRVGHIHVFEHSFQFRCKLAATLRLTVTSSAHQSINTIYYPHWSGLPFLPPSSVHHSAKCYTSSG